MVNITTAPITNKEDEKLKESAALLKQYLEIKKNSDALANNINETNKPNRKKKYERQLRQQLSTLKKLKNQLQENSHILNEIGIEESKKSQYAIAMQYYQNALQICQIIYSKEDPSIAGILHNIGDALLEQGDYTAALEHFLQVLEIRQKAYGNEHIEVADTFKSIGKTLNKQGKNYYNAALQSFKQAVTIYQKESNKKHPSIIDSLHSIGDILINQGHPADALQCFQQALEMTNDETPSDEIASLLQHIGDLLSEQGDHTNALQRLRQALEIRQKLYGNEHPDTALTLRNIGNVLFAQSDYTAALQHFQQALAIFEKVHDKEHPDIADTIHNIGNVLFQMGHYTATLQHYLRALEIYRKTSEPNDRRYAMTLFHIGDVLLYQGHHTQALQHYKDAIKIMREKYGNDHPDVARILYSIGLTLKDLCNYPAALSHFQQALQIRQKVHGNKHPETADTLSDIGTILFYQNDHVAALQHYQEALEIYLSVYDREHLDIASIYYDISEVLSAQGRYIEALQYHQLSQKIIQKVFDKKHHEAVTSQIDLAIAYTEAADSLANTEPNKMAEYFQEATVLLEESWHIDTEILEQRNQEFSSYDLVGHNKLVEKLTGLYRLQGYINKAAELCHEEALRYQTRFPSLALRYAQYALRDYTRLGLREKQAALYHLKAKILHSQQQLSLSIKSLQKALAHQSNSEWKETLTQWQTEYADKLSYIDKDLYAQLERCINSYHEILRSYLYDLEKGNTLSELSKNRTTELIIKLRNILDQAYGRFVRELIYAPNQDEKISSDIYYPFYSSWAELKNKFVENNLTAGYAKESDFELITLSDPRELVRALKKSKYLDENGRLQKNMIEADPELIHLDMGYDPHRSEISRWLMTLPDQTLVDNNIIGKAGVMRTKYEPPAKMNVIMLLEQAGFLKKISEKQWQITEAFHVNQPLQLNTKLTPWERQITKRLKEIKERYDFREHYPDSYKALHEEQSFYYYSEKANKETPHACRGAWLDKINAINNDSKHIRLTPQKLSSNLAERIGTIRKQHVKILIHYLEPDPFFYYWSFSDVLANAISSDEERIALSHAVLQTLYEKGYIEDKMVKHPIAEQILMAVKEEQNPKHIEKLKSEFRKKLRQDLPKEAQPHYHLIADFMIRRVLQRGHIRQEPDVLVEVEPLLRNALKGVIRIVEAFGRDRARYRNSQPIPIMLSDTLYYQEMPQDIQSQIFKLEEHGKQYIETLDQQNITLAFMQDCNRWLQALTKHYRLNQQPKLAGDLYVLIAQKTSEQFPWLAWRYYRKAMREYRILPGQQNALYNIYILQAKLYEKLSLFRPALTYYRQALNIQENSTLQKHYDELSAQYKGKTSRIDKDIYSQLEYAKERYLLLRYLIFKLTTRHEDIVLIQTIQNLAMELLTKIRHLLDHSFGRFVKLCIYRPNGYEAIDFNYPCTSSETQLEEQLGSKQDNDRSLFSTDNNKKSIKRDYPAVYAALCETQPFYYYNPEKNQQSPNFYQLSWLEKIISLCNAAKHVGLLSPSPKDLLDWWQKTNNTSLYPLQYTEQKLYPWSFMKVLNVDITVSSHIFTLLNNTYIQPDGIVTSKDLEKIIALQQKNDLEGVQRSKKGVCDTISQKIKSEKKLKSIKEPSKTAENIMEYLLDYMRVKKRLMEPSRIQLPAEFLIERSLQEIEKFIDIIFNTIPEPLLETHRTSVQITLRNANKVPTLSLKKSAEGLTTPLISDNNNVKRPLKLQSDSFKGNAFKDTFFPSTHSATNNISSQKSNHILLHTLMGKAETRLDLDNERLHLVFSDKIAAENFQALLIEKNIYNSNHAIQYKPIKINSEPSNDNNNIRMEYTITLTSNEHNALHEDPQAFENLCDRVIFQ